MGSNTGSGRFFRSRGSVAGACISYNGLGGILVGSSPVVNPSVPVSNIGMKIMPNEISTMAPTSRCLSIAVTCFLN